MLAAHLPCSHLATALLSAIIHLPTLRATDLGDAAERADWPTIAHSLPAAARATQPDGMTPLHWAAHHGATATVDSLLRAGADPRARTQYGATPLTLACTSGHAPVTASLLRAGADPNTKLPGGESALMTAARTGLPSTLRHLLHAGAQPNFLGHRGQTALMWAAADGHADAVRLLLAAGADPHQRLKSGFTAFLFAARNGHRPVIHALLQAGLDPNDCIHTDKGGGRAPTYGVSALLLAVENGHFQLALDLVNAGANPNDQRSGTTALHTLVHVRKPARGDDLAGQPAPTGSGLITSLDFIRAMALRGTDLNTPLSGGNLGAGRLTHAGATPFLLAAKTADLDMMRLLVSLGADPHRPNKDGTTPLMAAAGYGCMAPTEEAGTEKECLAAVDYLLTLGADINATDSKGETAMHGAAYKDLPKMVHHLASRGAKIETWHRKNKHGWSPITIAEGFRPGNFKPAPETLTALHDLLRAASIAIPAPTPRPTPATAAKGYPAP